MLLGLCVPRTPRTEAFISDSHKKLSQVIRHSFGCNQREENCDETNWGELQQIARRRCPEVRRGAQVWAEGLAPELTGA